jgi:hypothetical protein
MSTKSMKRERRVRGVKEEGVDEERVEGPQPARQRATFYFS